MESVWRSVVNGTYSDIANCKDAVSHIRKQISTIKLEHQDRGRGSRTDEQFYKHIGKHVNLDDEQAMSDACGAGFTVVGWVDEGCGKKNHRDGKPSCCPSAGAPTRCQWRGDDARGTKRGCSAQCYGGQINVAVISSPWGGGFTNDGNTNKCRRGYQSFCCMASYLTAVNKTCSMTDCGKSCSSGDKVIFKYHSDCCLRLQNLLRSRLVTCQQMSWVGDSGDCANVYCLKDETESVKRAFLVPMSQTFFDLWHKVNPVLANAPSVGSQFDPQPKTIDDRIMVCLGATQHRATSSLLEKSANTAKGCSMGLKEDAIAINDIAMLTQQPFLGIHCPASFWRSRIDRPHVEMLVACP